MRVPAQIPGLRLATLLLIAGLLIWIAFEGSLARVLLLGTAATLLLATLSVQRLLGGVVLSPLRWLLASALFGLVTGAGIPLLTLMLMVLKTGLHAHGPEFAVTDFAWVAGNLPAWAGGGLLAGTGLALITLALRHN